jgi:hypothetical protein
MIEASLSGYRSVREQITPEADSLLLVTLVLSAELQDLLVATTPPGAQVSVGGAVRGLAPLSIQGLRPGSYKLTARLDGYLTADTLITVGNGDNQVRVVLRPEPPAILVVQGDYPARIYIDEALAAENVQYSGRQLLRPGSHKIRVVLGTGEEIRESIEIDTSEEVVYDYSDGTVLRSRTSGNR